MSSLTANPPNNTDGHEEPSIDQICEDIYVACIKSVETGDFLSSASLVEFYMGNPKQFSDEDGVRVLETLYKSLDECPQLVYEMGWDLPELLLRYVDRYFEADMNTMASQKPFRLVMSLFSLICEKGNPRELFVRACELILSTESEKNRIKLQQMNLNGLTEDENIEIKSNQKGIEIDMPADSFESLDDTRQENVKFCTLFEVMRYSLQNINTEHPAGYLLEAARTMLQAANDPNADLLSATTYARRMYLLARDFMIPNEDQVSPVELEQVRKILVNFLSYAIEILLKKYSLKFSERLFVQMKNKVAMAPPSDRVFVYKESDYTRRLCEAISRMAQLILSYDFDPETEIQKWLGIRCNDADGSCERVQAQPPSSVVNNWNHKIDGEWTRALLEGPSFGGLLIVKTILHFDGDREKKPSWKTASIFTSSLVNRLKMTAGLKDVMLYWALWLSNYNERFIFDDDELLTEYLHCILEIISTSHSQQEKYVTGSIVARLLRFQSHKFAYNFCIDIMKNSNNSYQQFVVVECLKMLITGKVSGGGATGNGPIVLNKEQSHEISVVSQNAISRIFAESCSVPWYYLNFLSVVPTDPHVILELCQQFDTLTSNCCAKQVSESCQAQIQLINNAVEVLRSRAKEQLNNY